MFKSESYRKCDCCKAECAHLDQSDQERPCWGQVRIAWDEGEERIHACEGHDGIWSDGFYVPEELSGRRQADILD